MTEQETDIMGVPRNASPPGRRPMRTTDLCCGEPGMNDYTGLEPRAFKPLVKRRARRIWQLFAAAPLGVKAWLLFYSVCVWCPLAAVRWGMSHAPAGRGRYRCRRCLKTQAKAYHADRRELCGPCLEREIYPWR